MLDKYSNQNESVSSANSQAPFSLEQKSTEEEMLQRCFHKDTTYQDTIEWHTIHLEAVRKREGKDGSHHVTYNTEGLRQIALNQVYWELRKKSKFKDKKDLEEWLNNYAILFLASYCKIQTFIDCSIVGYNLETVRVRPYEEPIK